MKPLQLYNSSQFLLLISDNSCSSQRLDSKISNSGEKKKNQAKEYKKRNILNSEKPQPARFQKQLTTSLASASTFLLSSVL